MKSESRRELVAKRLTELGLDAYFGWSALSLDYLGGLQEHIGKRFMTLGVHKSGKTVFICAALSGTQAKRAGLEDVRTWQDGEDPVAIFNTLADEWNLRGGVIAVDEEMPALGLLKMQTALPAALFQDGGFILNQMRRQKNQAELDLLKKAAIIADEAFLEVLPQIRAGLTEKQVEGMLFKAMEDRGGRPDFGIVGTGANGAEPHHGTDSTVIKQGDVVILDFGCSVEDYRSDITRTVAVGDPGEKAHKVYEIVLQAHEAGRDFITKGLELGGADAAARKVIEDAGYGPQFMHRLGHGIGIQGHEEPYLMPGNEETFQIGDCFSIEPGIYLPGEFGIRLENIYHCAHGGAVSFNAPIPGKLPVI